VQPNTCLACLTFQTESYYYYNYSMIISDGNNYILSQYSDSNCTEKFNYILSLKYDTCESGTARLCSIFTNTTTKMIAELEISSTYAIAVEVGTVEFLFEATLSQTKFSAIGNIENAIIASSGSHAPFQYENQLSATTYGTTFGTFTYGEVYLINSFTFVVNLKNLNVSLLEPPTEYCVLLSPFNGLAVTGSETYYFGNKEQSQLIIQTNSDYSLDNLQLFGPTLNITNMELYSAYPAGGYGNLQYQSSGYNEPYLLLPCIFEIQKIDQEFVNVYNCHFETEMIINDFDGLLDGE